MPSSSSPLRERLDPFDQLSSASSLNDDEVNNSTPRTHWTVTPSRKNTPKVVAATPASAIKQTPKPQSSTPLAARSTPLATSTIKKTPLPGNKVESPLSLAKKTPKMEDTEDDEIILSMKNTPQRRTPTARTAAVATVSHVVISPVKDKKEAAPSVAQSKKESVFDRLYKGSFKKTDITEKSKAMQPHLAPTVIAPKSVKPLTIPKEFHFSSTMPRIRKVDKDPKASQQQLLRKRTNTTETAFGFKARPMPKSTPFVPKPSMKAPTMFKSPPLQTKMQAVKRLKFDTEVLQKQKEATLLAKQLQVRAQREEERRIKELRRTALVPKARPMPRLAPPPPPRKSAKMLTVPKSPKLSTSGRARRNRDDDKVFYA